LLPRKRACLDIGTIIQTTFSPIAYLRAIFGISAPRSYDDLMPAQDIEHGHH